MSQASQLLCSSETCGSRSDHRDIETGRTLRRTRYHPAFGEAAIGDRLLDVPNRDGLVHQTEYAG
jgi:hypothetical protein